MTLPFRMLDLKTLVQWDMSGTTSTIETSSTAGGAEEYVSEAALIRIAGALLAVLMMALF
jgi:hypothetical protein